MIEDHAQFMQDFSVVNAGGTCTLDGAAFDCIFDDQSDKVLNMMGGRNPVANCPEASLNGVDPRGKLLVINGTGYVVRENNPDGNGWTELELARS